MRRRQLLTASATLLLLMLLALIPVASVEAGRTHEVYLDDGQVVPAGSGNPNLFGEATVEANGGKGRLCWSMRVFILGLDEEVTGVTINEAPPGVEGPERAHLASTVTEGKTVSDCVSVGRALAHSIQKNPQDYYLLVTTTDYPDGAARAQFSKGGK